MTTSEIANVAEWFSDQISAINDSILEIFCDDPRMVNREGAYACIADLDGTSLCTRMVGTDLRGKRQKHKELCEEKARRLALLYPYTKHKLSRESEEDLIERYRGAVKCGDYIIAVSGYPGDIDEIMSAQAGLSLKLISFREFKKLVKKNPFCDLVLSTLSDVPSD